MSQAPRPNSYSATFLPKQRTIQERMWIQILRQPEFQSKSIDQLLEILRPHFICKSDDLTVFKKTPTEIVFEEKHSFCYGRPYRLSVGRITRGRGSVSYYAYRADRVDLPQPHVDFILKAINHASLDSSGPSEPANPSPAASAASSPAPSVH